jgi:hypothetical protein
MAVKGLGLFRDYFQGEQDKYVLIGGAACYLLMDDVGLNFRATKDLDIVLCVEALDGAFVRKFWSFVRDGDYATQQKSTGEKQFYRFMKPKNPAFPFMLELFSRQPDGVLLEGKGHLTPLPIDADASSLSAILMDNDYYQLLINGKQNVAEVSVLQPGLILVFKAKAWLDLSACRDAGEEIKGSDIKKHKNDVFRLFQLLSTEQKIELPDTVKEDMRRFIANVRLDPPVLKDLKIGNISVDDIFTAFGEIYQL